MEFLKISYDYTKKLYIVAYDPAKKETVVILYNYTGTNETQVTEKDFVKQWQVNLKDIILSRDLENFLFFGPSIFVAGTVPTPNGDTAGKLVSLDKNSGAIINEQVFDYSDSLDGFHGVIFTGENIFAYGYSHGVINAGGMSFIKWMGSSTFE